MRGTLNSEESVWRNSVPAKTATKTELVPLADRIVVTALKQEEETASGIIIPDTVKEKPQQGEVISVGPGKMDDHGNRITIDLSAGDRILYAKYAGTDVKLDGIDYIVLNEKDILCKLVS